MNLRPFVCSMLAAAVFSPPLVSAAEQQRIDASSAVSMAALETAFHEAVLKCFRSYRYDDSAMRELLRQGADVNAVDASGNNVLMQIIKAFNLCNIHSSPLLRDFTTCLSLMTGHVIRIKIPLTIFS